MSQEGASVQAAVARMDAAVAENRAWFIILGLLLILLGIGAIAYPFLTTIAAKAALGWLFLFGGIGQTVHAFYTRSWSEFFLELLVGLLYAAAGFWLAFYPLSGVFTLTLMVALLFIFQGVVEFGMAFRLRPRDGWGWMLFSAIVSTIAGIMILAGLPGTGTWVIGVLVGVNMITSGWAYLSLALAAGD